MRYIYQWRKFHVEILYCSRTKLSSCEIHSSVVEWIKNFLSDRKHSKSKWRGSILEYLNFGPLFIIPDIIYTTVCKMQQIYYIHNVVQMQLISYIHNIGRWRHLTHQTCLVLTNKTKLTLIVALTLTVTVSVRFFTRISSTPMKRLYHNNKINFCRGTVSGFVGGPVFSVFWLFTHLLTRIR